MRLIVRSPDNSAETGCRFKYMKPVLDYFSYDAVVEALNDAIDKEAEKRGITVPALIELNSAKEAAKGGIMPPFVE